MTTQTLERRTYKGEVEVRSAEDGSSVAFGYAARFNTLSQNMGGFVEQVDPKAFNQTVKEADVRALFNHDANFVLGRASAGTLRMEVDDVGLRYEIDLPPTALGNDLAVLLLRGDINGSSFGFRALEDSWGTTPDGFPLRTLMNVAVRDVGPVTFPAYTASDVALRSLAESSHIDLDELVAAAERNELRALILPTEQEEKAQVNPSPIFIRRSRGVR
jgi:HK97 family phage prohead protease